MQEKLNPFKKEKFESSIESYKEIPGYGGKYLINKNGDIISIQLKQPLKLKQYISNTGYMRVFLYKNKKPKPESVHRLMLTTFCRTPKNLEVCNHIDGNKLNNHISNLEWTTISGNTKHAHRQGLINQFGEKNPASLITDRECEKVVKLLLSGFKYGEIMAKMKETKINKNIIYNINKGISYKHISSLYVDSYPILKK